MEIERVEDLNQVCSEEKTNEEWRRTEMEGISPPPAPAAPPPPPPPPACAFNSPALDALERPIVEDVMEALGDPNIHLIGVYGSTDDIKDTLLEKVTRRIQRDNLFDLVLTANVRKKPCMEEIQEEIARHLGLTFNHKSKDKRAQELIERIKTKQKILIVLCNLHKGLDLGMMGIPYGSDHTGCKVLLTSTTEDVLSNHMRTQKNFMVDYSIC